MKKQLLALLLTTASVAGLAACDMNSSSPTDKAPGQYTSSTTSVTPNGTKVVNKTDTTVAADVNGKKTAVVKKKVSADPEGLMNKSSTDSTTVVEQK